MPKRNWFVGESELDPQEWGFDGTVWEEPEEPRDEPYLVAEGIRHKEYAALVAAAPDLLEACEAALGLIDPMALPAGLSEYRDKVRAMLRAAIAKTKEPPHAPAE